MKTLIKSLKESILSSTNTGKNKVIYEKIESWCKEFKPFNGKYKINSDNTISSTGSGNDILILRYDTYTELPNYIQFADDKNIRIAIGEVEVKRGYSYPYKKSHVKPALIESFRGLPKVCKRLDLLTESRIIPDLEIKAENVRLDLNWHLSSCGDIKIDFFGEGVLRIYNFHEDLNKLHIKNVVSIDMVNDFNFGDEFSKQMARKAPMNKYKNKFEFPVSDAGLKVINTFFGKTIDISKLESIEYTQMSKVVKINGQWYRCKNW